MYERKPLTDGIDTWKKYIEVIRTVGNDRFCMIETVKDDNPDQLLKDTTALKQIVTS